MGSLKCEFPIERPSKIEFISESLLGYICTLYTQGETRNKENKKKTEIWIFSKIYEHFIANTTKSSRKLFKN